MLFELLIAGETTKVRLKIKAATGGALMRTHRVVLIVAVFALTGGPPLIHVKAFAARHPPLSDFLRAARHEPEALALAVPACGFESVLYDLVLVVLEQVTAKASRFGADSETVLLGLWRDPGHI